MPRRSSTIERYQRTHAAAKEFIADRLGHDVLLLDDFCSHLGISRRHAQRALSHFGTSWRKLLTHARMHSAARMLRETDMSVKQVACKVGYRQPAQFAKAFRRECGVSPGDYRRDVNGHAH